MIELEICVVSPHRPSKFKPSSWIFLPPTNNWIILWASNSCILVTCISLIRSVSDVQFKSPSYNDEYLPGAPKNWCFWTMVLEKTLETPLNSKEIKPVNPKGNQSWIFIGRTDAEAETPLLWPPDVKNWLFLKDPDAGKDWGWEDKGMTEDEMVGWHHWVNGHESDQAPGVGDGQGGLVCCGSWDHKESDMTEQLNWTECIHKCIKLVKLL